MEDSGILLMETLAVRHHPMQQRFIEGKTRNSCQQPTITYNHHNKENIKCSEADREQIRIIQLSCSITFYLNHQINVDHLMFFLSCFVPRAPWQMSVRVAPSTIKCGSVQNSWGTQRRPMGRTGHRNDWNISARSQTTKCHNVLQF